MKNPYDFGARQELAAKKGLNCRWDNAFYKGKYYVYFGVVPVVTVLLPYYLIIGSHLPIYILVYIITVITVIGILLLLKEITERYFKNIPFLLFLLLFIFCSFSLLSVVKYPIVYNLLWSLFYDIFY